MSATLSTLRLRLEKAERQREADWKAYCDSPEVRRGPEYNAWEKSSLEYSDALDAYTVANNQAIEDADALRIAFRAYVKAVMGGEPIDPDARKRMRVAFAAGWRAARARVAGRRPAP